jgi:hypothetical protein
LNEKKSEVIFGFGFRLVCAGENENFLHTFFGEHG